LLGASYIVSRYFFRWLQLPERIGNLILALPVLLLIAAGITKGSLAHFAVIRTSEERSYFAAERWARANTPPDSMFYVPGEVGFSIYSRRPVWWDHWQSSGPLWEPSFYQLWACRARVATVANSLPEIGKMSVDANIDYLVLNKTKYKLSNIAGFDRAFENNDYTIFKRTAQKVDRPLCPDVSE
jgi:hypothetical protein